MAKVAVITGSNGLIGRATCRRLAPSGHLAVGGDVGAEGAGDWPHYECDLRDLGRMEATLAAIERDHGLIRVLFNNAGIHHPGKDGLDVPPDQFDDAMSVDVPVPFFASQWVAKRLIAADETGAIVTAARAPASGAALWRSMAPQKPPSSTSLEPRTHSRPAWHPCERDGPRGDRHGDGRWPLDTDSEGWCQVKRTGPQWRAGGDRIGGGFSGERRRAQFSSPVRPAF